MAPEWVCPWHAKRTRKVSQTTGAAYIGCPDCHSFSRLDPRETWLGWRIGYPRPPEPRLRPAPLPDLPF